MVVGIGLSPASLLGELTVLRLEGALGTWIDALPEVPAGSPQWLFLTLPAKHPVNSMKLAEIHKNQNRAAIA